MIPLLAQEAKKRQVATLKNQAHSSSAPIGSDEDVGRSRQVAAKALGIGATSVDRALVAKRDHPELYQ